MIGTYKKGQGAIARLLAVGALSAMGLYGCISLYRALAARSDQWPWLGNALNLGALSVQIYLLITIASVILVGAGILFILSRARVVDYLINSEAEMRKVSWPTKDELKRQTVVVIIFLAFFGAFLLLADLVFGKLCSIFYSGAI
jgi:preprotein translocase subunit SecE